MVHKNRLASNEKVIKHFEKEVSFPHKYIKRVNTSQSEAIILFDFCDATMIEDANQLQEKMDNFAEVQVVKVGNVFRLCPAIIGWATFRTSKSRQGRDRLGITAAKGRGTWVSVNVTVFTFLLPFNDFRSRPWFSMSSTFKTDVTVGSFLKLGTLYFPAKWYRILT